MLSLSKGSKRCTRTVGRNRRLSRSTSWGFELQYQLHRRASIELLAFRATRSCRDGPHSRSSWGSERLCKGHENDACAVQLRSPSLLSSGVLSSGGCDVLHSSCHLQCGLPKVVTVGDPGNMAVSAMQPFTSNACSPLCRIGCDGSREGSQTDASQRLTDAGGSAGASQRGSCSRSGRLASSPNARQS